MPNVRTYDEYARNFVWGDDLRAWRVHLILNLGFWKIDFVYSSVKAVATSASSSSSSSSSSYACQSLCSGNEGVMIDELDAVEEKNFHLWEYPCFIWWSKYCCSKQLCKQKYMYAWVLIITSTELQVVMNWIIFYTKSGIGI